MSEIGSVIRSFELLKKRAKDLDMDLKYEDSSYVLSKQEKRINVFGDLEHLRYFFRRL